MNSFLKKRGKTALIIAAALLMGNLFSFPAAAGEIMEETGTRGPQIQGEVTAESARTADAPDSFLDFAPDEDQVRAVSAEKGTESTGRGLGEAEEAAFQSMLPALIETGVVVPLTEAYFPDPAFRSYLTKKMIPVLEKIPVRVQSMTFTAAVRSDGTFYMFTRVLESSSIACLNLVDPDLTGKDLSSLGPCGLGITTLKGIEYFPSLTVLSCYGNALSELDLSRNTALTALVVSGNRLSKLDLSPLSSLTKLDCSHNNLTSINLSGCTELTALSVMSNRLTKLDISGCKKLTQFACTFNAIDLLDFRGNTVLDPFQKDSFNIAFQEGELAVICDPGSPMERYCELYLIPYSWKILPSRPSFSTAESPQIVVVKEKADLSAVLGALSGGKNLTKYIAEPKGLASVSKKGVLKGKKPGDVLVTALTGTGKDRTVAARYPVSVVKAGFREKKLQSVSVGQILYAEDNLTGIAFRPDSWLSSKPSVAEVQPVLGKILVKKRGTTKITAVYGSGKNAARISFRLKVETPVLSRSSLYLKAGKNRRLKLKKTKKQAVWRSSDSTIVTVGETTGLLTGVSPGTAVVTAYLDYGTPNQTEYQCRVTVLK